MSLVADLYNILLYTIPSLFLTVSRNASVRDAIRRKEIYYKHRTEMYTVQYYFKIVSTKYV